MSTIVKGYMSGENNDLLLKGAPDRVIEKCNRYMRLTTTDEQVPLKFT